MVAGVHLPVIAKLLIYGVLVLFALHLSRRREQLSLGWLDAADLYQAEVETGMRSSVDRRDRALRSARTDRQTSTALRIIAAVLTVIGVLHILLGAIL